MKLKKEETILHSFRLCKSDLDDMEKIAKIKNVTLSEVVRLAVKEYAKKYINDANKQ